MEQGIVCVGDLQTASLCQLLLVTMAAAAAAAAAVALQVSSVELERVVLQQVSPRLTEVAAVGVPAPGGGPDQLYMFVVASDHHSKRAGSDHVAELQALCQAALKQHLNPLFKVDRLLLVPELPRTASNKVVRRQLRDAIMAQRPKM